MSQIRHQHLALFSSALAALCLAVSSSIADAANSNLKPAEEYSEIAKLVAKTLAAEHLMQKPLDDESALKALELYLSALDPVHMYFLGPDIEQFRSQIPKLDDRLKDGDINFAYEVFNALKERVKGRTDYVRALLKNDMDLNEDEVFDWNRDEASWPADEKETDEFWRKRIKNQFVGRAARIVLQNSTNDTPEAFKQQTIDSAATNLIRSELLELYEDFENNIGEYDSEQVMDLYLSSFAKAYDPHCDYWSPSAAKDIEVAMRMSLVGIGVTIYEDDGGPVISRIIPGGPADNDTRETRLRPGDKILSVSQNGEETDVSQMHVQKVIRLIRGKEDTEVTIKVISASDADDSAPREIDLVRADVDIDDEAVLYALRDYPVDDATNRALGIVSLRSFYADLGLGDTNWNSARRSSVDVENALKIMNTSGVDGVILDLRGNGGGPIGEATEVSKLFLGSAAVVQVLSSEGPLVYGCKAERALCTLPLVVLVDVHTASASEIVAAALQDFGRAVIIGDRQTHGKGSVQTIHQLDKERELGRLKVTSSLFYRIPGGSTQLSGLSSDVYLPSAMHFEENTEFFLKNPLEWTMIRGVQHSPILDVHSASPELRKRSEKRREEGALKEYLAILDQLEELNDVTELPLSLAKRIALEKKRRNVLKTLIKYEGYDEETDTGQDVVLEESLAILSDLIDADVPQLAGYPVFSFDAVEKEKQRAQPEDTVSQELREEVQSLIEQLGSEKRSERKEARKTLRELGREILPVLKDNVDNEDPEISGTVRNLINKFVK